MQSPWEYLKNFCCGCLQPDKLILKDSKIKYARKDQEKFLNTLKHDEAIVIKIVCTGYLKSNGN